MRIRAIAPVLVLVALVGLGGAGCSKQLRNMIIPNQLPTVRLTWAPIDTRSKVFYVYKLSWVGYDPDGRVVRYEYAVDPPRPNSQVEFPDTQWVSTTNNEETILFKSAEPESAFQDGGLPRSEQFHVFAIRAVDNLGGVSAPVIRAFYSFGVAPVVQITEPLPHSLLSPIVTPAARITWTGSDFIDPFGRAPEKPVYYKYMMYKKGSQGVEWEAWRRDPDSLRRQVAPEFAGWDSIGPELPEVQFFNLTTGSEYLFTVVAFGRSGAYSSIFSFNSNMLRLSVGLAGELGPMITFFNSFFQYTYSSGGFSQDYTRAIQLQVPAEQEITFNWTAEPSPGSLMKRYRWVLDLANLDDETPRTDQNDALHWSTWSVSSAATVGPFEGAMGMESDTGEVHNFYLEAEDINGLVSLGWIQFRVYRPTFNKDLLIVNDTRFKPDERARIQPPGRTDSLAVPFGVWPSRAELDTFLFAVGGVRWKMTDPAKPWWALSPAGIFKGYSFDTLGTRMGLSNPTVSLGLLGQYRNIIWMCDRASSWTANPNAMTTPMPTLLYMSQPSRQNTLATWVKQGGQLWALGGGFGNHTNSPWNNPANDLNGVRTYRFDGTRPDLTPGRFMFDLAHWRSEFRIYGPAFVSFRRYDQPDPIVNRTSWKGGTFTSGVDYTSLPTALRPRDPSTDTIWPWRTNTEFYLGNSRYSAIGLTFEFISLEHRMTEEIVPSPTNPDSTVERSTLDSLYLVFGSSYPRQLLQSGEGVNTVMTYYYGPENARLVFSGMSIWDFTRADCVGLVDFVLEKLWGLHRSTLYTAPRTVARPVASSVVRRPAVPAPQTLQRPPGSARQPVGTSTFQRWR